jgi:hypothetical protein
MKSTRTDNLSKWDFALFALLAAGLLLRCLVGDANRPFWCDEMQSAALFQKGWTGALNLFWREQILPSPPLYVLFGGAWMTLFGFSDLGFRSFSCASLIAAAAVLWVHLRRGCGTWVTALAIAIPFTSAVAITNNLSEGRYYGLYIAAVAAFLVCIQQSYREPSFRNLAFQALAAAMVVTCHFHGLFYVSFITLLVLFPLLKQWKILQAVRVSMASGIGCIALLSWVFPLIAYSHALNFAPGFQAFLKELVLTYAWIIPLPGRGLLHALHPFHVHNALVLLSFLGGISLLLVLFRVFKEPLISARESSPTPLPETRLQLLIACGLFFLPIMFWIVAFIHPNLFVNRYLTPSVLWAPFFLAPMLNSEIATSYLKGILPCLLFVLLLCNVVGTGLRGGDERAILAQDISKLGTGEPVVFNCVGDWAVFSRYAHRQDFLYIQDKETALGKGCLDSDKTSYYISHGFRHQGFDSVIDLPDFVKNHHSFLAVTPENFKLLDVLFLNNPDYSCKQIGSFPATMHYPSGAKVWRVEKKQ